MSSAREAQGTVSQKHHANTSGNHRESSPTLSAAGYGAKGTEETQGTARSRAPLREASAGTARNGSEGPRSEKERTALTSSTG